MKQESVWQKNTATNITKTITDILSEDRKDDKNEKDIYRFVGRGSKACSM